MHLPDGLAAATVAGDHTGASASGPTEPRYADRYKESINPAGVSIKKA